MFNGKSLFLLISLTINYVAPGININPEICKSGAKCMILEDCVDLYERFNEGTSAIYIKLFQKLQCGFNGNQSKICCPPNFLTSVGDTSNINQTNKLKILPNNTVCGIDTKIINRISGGEETEIGEHPWLALLNYGPPSTNSFYCSGVLISSRYVMTAAHCVKRTLEDVTVSQVRLGEWDLLRNTDCSKNYCSSDAIDVDVEEVVVHENFIIGDPSFHHDIALLRLAQDVTFSDFIRPICLPIDTEIRENNFEHSVYAEIAGWGQNEYSSFSEKKLKAKVSVVNLETCKKVYAYGKHVITNNHICAGGERGKDICDGDSGGPLMVQVQDKRIWMAVGVSSFGPATCGVEGWPSVFTRVTSYIPWILSKIRP
ncbi:CLIP domain-containing serine protease HP8-like [Danaus plexippus]|uniref:CLIP domain-containing serine protease HP8-like n=1 Tax=Danaus plexippus TaxID=13037 RepID=UPI002AAFEE7E|nr:CLIP domain-containing serine protease HP8-like [Danaus plexippus]